MDLLERSGEEDVKRRETAAASRRTEGVVADQKGIFRIEKKERIQVLLIAFGSVEERK